WNLDTRRAVCDETRSRVHLIHAAALLALAKVEVFADALALAPHFGEEVQIKTEHQAFGARALLGLHLRLLRAVGVAFGAASRFFDDLPAERDQAGDDLMLAPRLQGDAPVVRANLVVQTWEIPSPPIEVGECQRGGTVALDGAGSNLDLLDGERPAQP